MGDDVRDDDDLLAVRARARHATRAAASAQRDGGAHAAPEAAG